MIEVSGLTKEFKVKARSKGFLNQTRSFFKPLYHTVTAVDHIDFSIEDGDVVGFIGRNGAGKSTTIKMLSGILYPTSGKALVEQIEPYKNKKHNAKNIGVVFGQRTQLWWDIPVADTFELFKRLYKITDKDYNKRVALFREMFSMDSYIDKPVRQLSLGQRMCADLCAAMLHNPNVIFLDEPTIGLDVINKENMRNFVKYINEEFNTTFIITSHDLVDIENLCNKVMIIEQGKLIYQGDLQQLKSKYSTRASILFTCRNLKLDEARKIFDGAVEMNCTGEMLTVVYNPLKHQKVAIISEIIKHFDVLDITLKETSLEEIIKQIYTN
ncbi:ATP-binding cassette domain-containing protein [Paenibacillus polymyxa]|uniref:ATP-binding cassette domain-containing protein n=1 Tax=Paenibacillus polymyxa TaxID=1406 RepID=A0A8I1ITE3_PAEPO|nr:MULTISPECIES: ATP-binding cassette domain-containing protein [Paenibacillus]KAF6569865.1 ATP-binding cassette domain-containing protein [Paenibacillus sp. EKM206P]KAF6585414.1 ATP-binding cassette domain-containing protein [Paenibacillus sp. EKM205P]MBM0635687.1 ATP-binding cassette domain-containing protein [Paenibacillus polymyxa]